ncbi:MAG TPA: SAM-dependent methyltransferase [Actinocrinis sp.]|uniref:SAM-dependent methyltransferase n=1 Tax=Actinocrinis sp. TaxID=1920516 RepID=UPI002DDC92F7|nr:SAM-dependent methyltransferase [Actinocrinis sp.]HEV2342647.1 SAM-dependent methyltransferase [Actinocrinis sp.]
MAGYRPAWVPDEVDIERPSAARMYDYYLGGSHNLAADRAMARQTMQVWPDVRFVARANRAYLRRAVTYVAEMGVEQFLDLGSGIPTAGNVHEVARAVRPAARTVYVDVDPVAVAHSAALLSGVAGTGVLHADMRDPQAVLDDAIVTGLLDFSRPIAILMISVLPFVIDDDHPAQIVADYRDATVPGSYLVISHGTDEYMAPTLQAAWEVYERGGYSVTTRSRAQILALMDGYELVEPGLVDTIAWRPDPVLAGADPLGGDVARYSQLAAVGRRL